MSSPFRPKGNGEKRERYRYRIYWEDRGGFVGDFRKRKGGVSVFDYRNPT